MDVVRVVLCGAWLAAVPAPAPAQEAAPQKGAVVEGVVVNALTGEPLRRVEVGLLRLNDYQGGPVRMTAQPAQGAPEAVREAGGPLATVTGADGSFRFENVPDGTYGIQLQRKGLLLSRARPGLSPMRIEVRGGAPVRGLRFAMAPMAVIAGKVVDDEGEPVEGAQLALLRRSWDGGRLRWAPTGPFASTDDRGEFRLPGIRPGKYLLLVKPPYLATMPGLALRTVYAGAYYPDAADLNQAKPLTVAAGQEITGLTLRLRTVPARSISVAVLLPDGTPAQGAFVSAVPVDRDWIPTGEGRVLPGEAPGRFVIDGLAPGRYRLVARLASRAGMTQPSPAGMVRLASREVDVTESDAPGIEIRFDPPATIQGKLVVEGPGSEAMKSELAGLRVFIRTPEGLSSPVPPGADGTFQTESGSAGRHELSVIGSALQKLYVAAIRTSSGADASDGLQVSGGSAEPVTVVLRTDGARLTASRPPSARPEEACTPYFAVLYAPGRRGPQLPWVIREVEQDRPAVLFPLAPGEYVIGGVCAPEPSEVIDPEFLERLTRDGARLRLQPGQQASVELKDVPMEER